MHKQYIQGYTVFFLKGYPSVKTPLFATEIKIKYIVTTLQMWLHFNESAHDHI